VISYLSEILSCVPFLYSMFHLGGCTVFVVPYRLFGIVGSLLLTILGISRYN
jgi:hypothetical protein